MKRILFIDHVTRILGGAEINLLELLAELKRRNELELICACAPTGMLHDKVKQIGLSSVSHFFPESLNQYRIAARSFSLLGAVKAWAGMVKTAAVLNKTISEVEPSAIVTCTNKDHFCAARATRRSDYRVYWWVNDAVTADFFSWPARTAFRSQAAYSGQKQLAVSNYVKNCLTQLGLPESNILLFRNGLPLPKYQQASKGTLKNLLNLDSSAKLIGIAGRYTPWKGQDFFLRIAKEWLAKGENAHFILIGHAFNEDQAYAQCLHEFVQANKLQARVHFLPFQENIPAVFADLDLLVHASLKPEPFGRVVAEAMALGVTVVAAAAGGIPEIVDDGVNGFLAESGNLQSYLCALERALNSPLEDLKTSARGKIEQEFSLDRLATQFTQLPKGVGPQD